MYSPITILKFLQIIPSNEYFTERISLIPSRGIKHDCISEVKLRPHRFLQTSNMIDKLAALCK